MHIQSDIIRLSGYDIELRRDTDFPPAFDLSKIGHLLVYDRKFFVIDRHKDPVQSMDICDTASDCKLA